MQMWACFLIILCHPQVTDQSNTSSKTIPFGGTDFKQYYTTSRLIIEGQNPYDYERAGVIQRALGENKEIQIPYGPPTSLLPFIPLGWVDFLTAIQIQFVLNVTMLVVSCFLWGMMLFPHQPLMPILSTSAVVAWIPCLSLFGMGHVTSWTLLGFTLWCFFMKKEKPTLAGCCLALSIIKPHLALGLIIYAFIVGWRQRNWRMMISLVGTVAVMIIAMWIIRPSVWGEYFSSLKHSNPTQWFNATLDGWGRFTFDAWGQQHLGSWFHFRIFSAGIGLALLAGILYLGWQRPDQQISFSGIIARQESLVLALWMAATPYAFSYDYVLLLPAFILALGSWLYRSHPYWHVSILGWIALDITYVLMKGQCYEYQYFFMPLAGLVLSLLLTFQTTQTKHLNSVV